MAKDPRFDPEYQKTQQTRESTNQIQGKEIGNSTILTEHLVNGSVTADKIASGAVTPGKISTDWPAFYALSAGTNKSTVSGGILVFNGGVRFNNGNHYNASTYRFTVPITGLYYFWLGYFNNSTAGPERLAIAIDGNTITTPYLLAPSLVVGSAHMGGLSLYVNANQLVDIRAQYGNGVYYGDHTAWGGYLIR
jgi:hypothetical protein